MLWQVLDVAGSVLFVADAVAATTFVVVYAVRSRWRSTPVGMVLLGVMAVIAVILDVTIALELLGDVDDRVVIVLRVVLYGGLLGGLVHLLRLLLRAQRRVPQGQDSPPSG